ncbi:hypothetical protein H7U19_14685 [Hyunsoonleella sp. SJ7]|uniref:Uncharacterized protein n=1 Tax=Hyunsoonleella aquatilis TaxID=2762758 RepID=A0A923HHZ8_9FLAO|nr:hypothetical protein [Hyunsoonleella aquatilis]MBC3759660.1 hypothetical protein [Hyunsoonleella aquatilis]
MKNLILTFVSVLALTTINAQMESFTATIGDIDFNTIMFASKTDKNITPEASYSNETKGLKFSSEIKALQNEIAQYSIAKNSIYDNSEKAIYDVSFKKEHSRANVIFNNEGEVIKSLETYKNIKLPLSLRIKILNENPLFIIKSNKVTVAYTKFFGTTISYKVTIYKGKNKRILKFDEDFKLI